MDEKKNKNYYKKPEKASFESTESKKILEVKSEIEEETPIIEEIKEEVFEEEPVIKETKNFIKGKVRCAYDNGDIAVNLDNGEFVMKRGYFNAKVGDILSFEI